MRGSLAAGLQYFVCEYVMRCRGLSANTLQTYRQGLDLFVGWLKKRLRKDSARRIPLGSIRTEHILDFLAHLEDRRGGRSNGAASRNARLAAIKGLFRAAALWDARYGDLAQRIEAIPAKRMRRRDPDYLTLEELREVFRDIDTSTGDGVRDAAIFLFMVNCGARASEVAGAELSRVVLDGGFRHAQIVGKGNRERVCPLWDETAALLKHYLQSFRRPPRAKGADRLFVNRRGGALTRSGILKLVKRHVGRTMQRHPALARKRISAHSLRHSTGVLLRRAGVDMSVIRSWLGHVRLDTTQLYARLTALDKRDALDKYLRLGSAFAGRENAQPWPPDRATMDWLASL